MPIRGSYNPGSRPRPVAVALSPMVVEQMPHTAPLIGTLITLPKPPLPEPGDVPMPPPPTPSPAQPKLVEARIGSRYKSLLQPDYPAREQRSGIEGMVKVRVLIGKDGRVKAVGEMRATSPGFFEETRRRALSKWRFKPATRDDVAEESWQVMTVRFQIRNG